MTNMEELLQSSPILNNALRISERRAIRPRELLRKLGTILSVLTLGLLSLVFTLLSIKWRVFGGADQQAFASMLVLLSGALIVFSVIGGFLTIWNAFVSTYLELRGSQVETAEVTDQYQILVGSVVTAAPVPQATWEAVEGELAFATSVYPVNEPLAQAVKAVARAAPAETAKLVTAFRAAAGETMGVGKVRE